MTSLRYEPGSFRLTLRGHAGAGAPGADPVCAAVSALGFALANAALARPDYRARVSLDPARAGLTVSCRPRDPAACAEMFRTVLTGFRALEQQFPEHVRVKSEE